jgi:hypothetical protein
VPVVGALMILGVYAFADGFNPGASSGEYMLGGSWQTWALSAVLFAAAPISYGPSAAHPGHWLPGMGPASWAVRYSSAAVGPPGAGCAVVRTLPAVGWCRARFGSGGVQRFSCFIASTSCGSSDWRRPANPAFSSG